MLTDFSIKNYRSIKDVWLKLKRVNVFVGPNGCGKSNMYRAMYLLASTASGQLARHIADEGGMGSISWGGGYGKSDSSSTFLSAKIDNLEYELALGRDVRLRETLFYNDLEVKSERLFSVRGEGVRMSLLNRGRAEVKARDSHGQALDYTQRVEPNESVLTGVREPHLFPQLSMLREELLSWRFYHHFRTDRQSPLRKPQLAIGTAVMAEDGSDFVSALATILEMGRGEDLLECLEQAFPGSDLTIAPTQNGKLRLSMTFPDINRPLDASELSDGTLQYLCLLASVFSLRPPSVLAINEPETSIHPTLFDAMAKMLKVASEDSQIWITTHSQELADYMLEYTGCSIWTLEKVEGETRLVGVGLGGYKEDDDETLDN